MKSCRAIIEAMRLSYIEIQKIRNEIRIHLPAQLRQNDWSHNLCNNRAWTYLRGVYPQNTHDLDVTDFKTSLQYAHESYNYSTFTPLLKKTYPFGNDICTINTLSIFTAVLAHRHRICCPIPTAYPQLVICTTSSYYHSPPPRNRSTRNMPTAHSQVVAALITPSVSSQDQPVIKDTTPSEPPTQRTPCCATSLSPWNTIMWR